MLLAEAVDCCRPCGWAEIGAPPTFGGALFRGRPAGRLSFGGRSEPAGRPSFRGRPTGRLTLVVGELEGSALMRCFFPLPLGRPGPLFTGMAGSILWRASATGAPDGVVTEALSGKVEVWLRSTTTVDILP